jgi:[ribosomal protein S18]-alanine N-acetyltransferase
MALQIGPIDRDIADVIATWRYEGQHSIYDGDPSDVESILRPEYAYQAVTDENGVLIGFCNFGKDARVPGYAYSDDAIDVGVGLRPDLVGRGLGVRLMRTVLDFARRRYGKARVRVTIAAFNLRAQRLGLAIGFHEEARFVRRVPDQPITEFVVLVLDE